MFEAAFRMNHNSLYANITQGREAEIEMWCNNHCDMLHVEGEDATAVIEHVDDQVGVRNTISREGEIVLVTTDCLLKHEEDLLETYLRRHDCLSFPPRIYAHGQITARVIALEESELHDIYEDLCSDYTVTVDAKREITKSDPDAPLLVTNSALPSLSERQKEALFTAYEAGYYEIPRECTTRDIGDELGIGRRTAEEHLRLAEQKIIEGFVDYILRDGPAGL